MKEIKIVAPYSYLRTQAKVLEIVSRLGLIECYYLQGNMQKETNKSIYKQCGKFGDSRAQQIPFYRAFKQKYLLMILKTLT